MRTVKTSRNMLGEGQSELLDIALRGAFNKVAVADWDYDRSLHSTAVPSSADLV
jgi:hypothetical protein